MQNTTSTPDSVKNKSLIVVIILLLLGFLFLCCFATFWGFGGNIKYNNSREKTRLPVEVSKPTISLVVTPEPTIVQNPAEGITSFFVLFEDNPKGLYLNAEFPQGSAIEYVSENAINKKTLIKYQSREILSFSFPHMAIPERIETYRKITDSKQDGLYRIILQNGKEYYSNNVNLTETCTMPEILNPPCASPTVYLESLDGLSYLEIEFMGGPGDREVADSIMRTLVIVP